jgi:triosephosphate isomerase (TIM)
LVQLFNFLNFSTMNSPLIIANWKMKLSPEESLALARKVGKASAKYKNAEVAVCPAFTELAAVADIIKNTSLLLGAQDCFWETSGAFTGEVSPTTLKSYGAQYAIIGHSERRMALAESGQMVQKKLRAALTAGLTPVLCVGESFSERQEGQKEVVLLRELNEAFKGVWFNKLDRLVVAYEPVWVIGSGQAVEPEEAEHTSLVIKHALYDLLPPAVVDEQTKIIYGGSVDPENVSEFLKQPTVAGVLVGTACLDATVFSALVAAAGKV